MADADYRAVHTRYDDLGRVVETRQLAGAAAKITLQVDPDFGSSRVLKTVFNETYDAAAIQSTSSTTYDPQGRVFKTVSADNLTTYFEYDAAGRQQAVIMGVDLNHDSTTDITFGGAQTPANPFDLPDGGAELVRTEFTYDQAGRQEIVTDARNVQTKYVYDNQGRVLATIVDEGELEIVTQSVFDSVGRRIAEIDPRGRRTEFEYDGQGRLVEVRLPRINDADGGDPAVNKYGSLTGDVTYQYRYDDYGNQVLIRDPMDNDLGGSSDKDTTFTYDHQGRQRSRTLPSGEVEWMIYDDTAVSTLATPAATSSTALGELAFSVDFEGNLTSYLYDNSEVGGGRLVSKRYYDADQLIGVAIDGSTTADYLANEISSLALTPDRSVSYAFDALGRATTVTNSEFSSPTVHAYDIDGRLIQLDSPQGVIHYEYDDLDRITRTYTGGLDQTAGNAAGDLEEYTDTRYEYDELGRLKTVTATERKNDGATGEGATEYFYDKNGNLDRTELPNGVSSDYVYDNANRLTGLYHYVDTTGDADYQVGDDLRVGYDYQLDKDGRRRQEVESDAAGVVRTIDWVYDELGRLSEERHNVDAGGSADDFITHYGYDLAGNRRLMERDNQNSVAAAFAAEETTAYQYDANDRLEFETKNAASSADDRHIVYQYDGTTQTRKLVYHDTTATPASLREEVEMSYDSMGRLESITETPYDTDGSTPLPATTTTYEYNESGLRVSQTVDDGGGSPVTTIFHIDPNNHTGYAQILEEGVDDNADGRLDAGEIDTVYTLGHDVIAQTVAEDATGLPPGVNPSDVIFFLHDGHGSTQALTDAANAIVQRFAYDAYGLAVLSPAEAALTRLLYSGEQTDPTGLQYLRARYYDPASGRFNRLDPFAGNLQDPQSLHKYLYAHGDPVNGIDPSGLVTLANLGVGSSISGNQRAQSASVNVSSQVRLGRALKAFSRIYSKADKAWDWVNAARDAFDLFNFDPSDVYRLTNVLTGKLKVGGPVITVALPSSIKRKLRNVLGPFKGALDNNVAQEWIGVLGSVLVGKALGFEASSVGVGYTGIDGILHSPKLGYAIVEAKGGSSRLSPGQMEDRWIQPRLSRLARNNRDPGFTSAVLTRQPMTAMVVSLDVTQNRLKVQMKMYPGITGWGKGL